VAGAGEREYLCLHDNVAVLFFDDHGKTFWCLGHIEEIVAARSAVPVGKCSADLEVVASTADHQTKVDMDDPHAMYQLRWFQEVNAKGKVIPGYGNPGCKAYHLPLNNGGLAFEWTANHQVICPVTLKRADDGSRTWTVRKEELNMIVAKLSAVTG
jgi:hypothetical protein